MDITIVGIFISALGIIASSCMAAYALNENHKWNRRNYTVSLFSQWDDRIGEHRKEIERIRPSLLDFKGGKQQEISRETAEEIYSAASKTPEWELRIHFIQMLNFYETIAIAYKYHVGDQKMMDISFREVLLIQHDMLRIFIKVVSEERGYKCWKPFEDLINEWKHNPSPEIPKTGRIGKNS